MHPDEYSKDDLPLPKPEDEPLTQEIPGESVPPETFTGIPLEEIPLINILPIAKQYLKEVNAMLPHGNRY